MEKLGPYEKVRIIEDVESIQKKAFKIILCIYDYAARRQQAACIKFVDQA